MHRDQLGSGSGAPISFDTIGQTIEGEVLYVGDWEQRTNRDGKEQTILRVALSIDGVEEQQALWVRQGSQMADAIRLALVAADEPALVIGQRLKMRYEGNQDTGRPSPMKRYRCKITPAPKTSAMRADDDWDTPAPAATPAAPPAPAWDEEPF